MADQTELFPVEIVPIRKLKPHPRNYNAHPDDEIKHIAASIEDNGLYRNIVVADDYTILAGHGVWEAAQRRELLHVPVIRLPFAPESPQALKVLTGDNEIAHLSEKDDRLLSELLREIKDADIGGLLGTGYDERMLAALAFVTRPESEIADFQEAAEWAGMPEFEIPPKAIKVVVNFRNMDDRAEFARILGLNFTEKTNSTWWPYKADDDVSSVKFVG